MMDYLIKSLKDSLCLIVDSLVFIELCFKLIDFWDYNTFHIVQVFYSCILTKIVPKQLGLLPQFLPIHILLQNLAVSVHFILQTVDFLTDL